MEDYINSHKKIDNRFLRLPSEKLPMLSSAPLRRSCSFSIFFSGCKQPNLSTKRNRKIKSVPIALQNYNYFLIFPNLEWRCAVMAIVVVGGIKLQKDR